LRLEEEAALTVATVSIGKVDGQSARRSDDLVAVEEPLEIRVGGESLTITMRTPGNDFELAAGFLYSEAMVEHYGQIRSIGRPAGGSASIVEVVLSEGGVARPPAPQRSFVMTSACGLCGKSSLEALENNRCPELPADQVRIDPAAVYALPALLRQRQATFETTGGIHAAALFSLSGDLLSLREDVGRHNAVDKLIGAALMEGRLPLSNTVMLVSGRASYELVQKALMGGIPVLAAVGAPSSLAVATAERGGMTLIGFLRDGRFNVYSGSRRVIGLQAAAGA
jgi:FdhD protein